MKIRLTAFGTAIKSGINKAISRTIRVIKTFDKRIPKVTYFVLGIIFTLIINAWEGREALEKRREDAEMHIRWADKLIGNQLFEDAIGFLKQAGENISEKEDRRLYAKIKQREGLCYFKLGERGEDPERNATRAVSAFEEALANTSEKQDPTGYVAVLNDLAAAYIILAGVRSSEPDLRKSLDLSTEALKVYEKEGRFINKNAHYGRALHNSGMAFEILAKLGYDTKSNGEKAAGAFEDALKYRTEGLHPLEYASTQNNLGISYWLLSNVEEDAGIIRVYLKKAEGAFNAALEIYNIEEYAEKYATIKHNLGTLYRRKYEASFDKSDLARSISYYLDALIVYRPSVYPSDYSLVQNNLGNTFHTQAESETGVSKIVSVNAALEAFREALEYRAISKYPLEYAETQIGIGSVYITASEIDNATDALTHAIEAFENALKVFTPEGYPEFYAMTQNNLAEAYRRFYEETGRKEYLCMALIAIRKTQPIYTKADHPIDYAMVQAELASIYIDVSERLSRSEYRAKELYLNKAIKSAENALAVYKPEKHPREFGIAHYYRGKAFAKRYEITKVETDLIEAESSLSKAITEITEKRDAGKNKQIRECLDLVRLKLKKVKR